MTLTLELPDSKEAALKARAREQGVSAEQYVQQVLDQYLEQPPFARDKTVGQAFVPAAAFQAAGLPPNKPFWQTFTEQMQNLPDDVLDRLPTDGAAEHDHYLYGSPKKNS